MSIDFFLGLFPKLLEGLWTTILLLVFSGILGNLLAVPVALSRLSPNPLLRWPSYAFVNVIRGTPLLVQIYIFYFGFGDLFGRTPEIRQSFLWPYLRDGFFYAIIALSVSVAAYSGEVLRGAIRAVPHGEIEAARACGMSRGLILRRITLPRALRIALPTFGGETILLLKSTALASTVTVMDLMGVANFIRAQTFRVYETLLAAAILYVALTFILTRLFAILERRLNRDRLPPPKVKVLRTRIAEAGPA
jgi:His/Glu/Gln/Arg/opine family amino acid ABC transporter permease subunit